MPPIRKNDNIEVSSQLAIIDLNGTQKNFETKFQITSQPPPPVGVAVGERYVVAVVSQEELDNQDYTFEPCDPDGSYTRKIIRQDDTHQNYFIAIKKHPTADKNGPPIKCNIVKEMSELPENKVYALPPSVEPPQPEATGQATNQEHDLDRPLDDQHRHRLIVKNELPVAGEGDQINYLFMVGIIFIVLALYLLNKKK